MTEDAKHTKEFVIISLQGILELMKAGSYRHAQHFLTDFIKKANGYMEPYDYIVEDLDKDIEIK